MLPRVNLVRTDDADYLLFSTSDWITQHILRDGRWEPNLLTVVRAFASGAQKPVILDIGANLGGFAVPAAKMIAPSGGTIVSFEPQRIVYYQLCGNIFLNRLDNVIAHNLAVGELESTLQLPVPDYARLSNVGGFSVDSAMRERTGMQKFMSAATETVRCVNLDTFTVPGRVSFIKIDVEGAELQVLRGAGKFLAAQSYPPIFFEAWSEEWFARDKKALMDHVQGLGYKVAQLGSYDHIAQHPAHPVQVEFTQPKDGVVSMRRV